MQKPNSEGQQYDKCLFVSSYMRPTWQNVYLSNGAVSHFVGVMAANSREQSEAHASVTDRILAYRIKVIPK